MGERQGPSEPLLALEGTEIDPSAWLRLPLTPAGRQVVEYVIARPEDFIDKTALEIAADVGTSDATVVRTIQALGFSGLPELKQGVRRGMIRSSTPVDDFRRMLANLGPNGDAAELVLRTHERALSSLRSPEVRQTLARAADITGAARRVVVSGMGASVGLAAHAAAILARYGLMTRAISLAREGLEEQLLDLQEGDVLVILAPGRSDRSALIAATEAQRLGVQIILFGRGTSARLSDAAGLVVPLKSAGPGHLIVRASLLAAFEMMAVTIAVTYSERAIQSLDRLTRLRGLSRAIT